MSRQIAAKEALPLQEIRTNPFVVMCTTSLGGHLSWFETGGGRWFAKPVRSILVPSRRAYNKLLGNPVPCEDG